MKRMQKNSKEEKEFFRVVREIENSTTIEREEVETILCLVRTVEGLEMLKQHLKEQGEEWNVRKILHEVSKISKIEEQFFPWDDEEDEEWEE